MNDTERQAHQFADHGWHVFPARPGRKEPMTGHGLLDATTSHQSIQRWWRRQPDANLAIRTGAPHGPDVLDVDNKPGGQNGFLSLGQLARAGLVPPAQAHVRTPSGGAHLYYRGTAQRSGSIPQRAIDYRASGGYVLAPPSRIDGRPYELVRTQPSPHAFDWAAAQAHLQPSRQATARQPDHGSHAGRSGTDAGLARWVAARPEGTRNAGLYWAACRALEHRRQDLLPDLVDAAKEAGLDDREIAATLRSAEKAATRPLNREAAS